MEIDFCCDQGKCCGKKRYPKKSETKSRSISEYFSIYAGPEYVIAGRQAVLQCIIMTCFLFGPGIPILFIFGLVSIVLIYLFEKKTLTRQCRLPANFDAKMNKKMVSSLLYAPILYSAIGYWMYSNPSMQSQNILSIHLSRSITPVQRKFSDLFIVTPASLYLVLFVICVLAKIDYHTKWSDKNIFHDSKLKKKFQQIKED